MRYLSSLQFYNSAYIGSYVDGGIEDKSNVLKEILDVWDEPATIVDILEQTGRYFPTHDPEFYSYTNSSLFTTLVVDGNQTTITAGNTGTLAVDDASNVKKGDVIQFPDGSLCRVESISTNTLTVYAVDTLTLTAADNFVLSIPYNVIGEGSYSPDEPASSLVKRSNQVQAVETSTKITDYRKAAKTIVDFGGGKGYFYKDQHDTWKKHLAKIGFAFIVGKKATFDDPDDAGTGKILMSRGLDDYIVNFGGVSLQASNAASNAWGMDFADWASWNRTLTQQRAPMEGFFWTGFDMGVAIDDMFREELTAGAIVYNAFGKGNGKNKAIDLGVKSFSMYDRTFHKSSLMSLNHPNVTAATGHLYTKYGYFIPTNKQKGESGRMQDRIRGRYLDIDDGFGRRFREKVLGGLAPHPTERANVIEFSYTSYEGLELLGTDHFGRLQLA